jgi:phage replication-related protein YjqB (UPF0714/DUF867 family)
LAAGLFLAALPARGNDAYRDFAELKAAQKEGEDFRITAVNRGSSVTVFAIHAGQIEPGTGEIARILAGDEWNLYLFEGFLGKKSRRLHITAADFDEPAAVALASAAVLAVSVHGERDAGEAVCVGGSDTRLRHRVAESLAEADFAVEEPCRRLPGEEPRNIVNRARRGGVQLELPRSLIRSLLRDRALMEAFRVYLRRAVVKESQP